MSNLCEGNVPEKKTVLAGPSESPLVLSQRW